MADILIRMEMPHDCSGCSVKVDPDTRQCCVDKHLFEETLSVLISRRDKDCPLHELPPHGNLIDIRTVLEIVMQYVPDDDGSCSKANADLRELLDAIENAPAIVPAERREGDA